MVTSGDSGLWAGGDGRTVIRPIRASDVRHVLAISRHSFPTDPWTRDTAGGRLARSPLGAHRHKATLLAGFIRLARVSDAVGLVRLISYLVRRPATEYRVVAAVDGQIVGFGYLQIEAGSGKIQTMAVRGDYQRHGVGTALLSELLAAGTARGCGEILLDVRADNAQARRIYQRAGFTELEVRPRYYQPSGTDGVVMKFSTAVDTPAQ
ncbi:MAG TPA: ribosomal protein S18-alanine N-acetyltransferase [Streptosporangiaceae bacterium]|nr:ribosomal protein S18-alanine N-acetyltransferase [Streptosporangiaceae bacterium]